MMGNRPHPNRRGEDPHGIAMRMALDPDFQAACDRGFLEGMAEIAAEKAKIIYLAENSPEQRDWESDDAEDYPPQQAGG